MYTIITMPAIKKDTQPLSGTKFIMRYHLP